MKYRDPNVKQGDKLRYIKFRDDDKSPSYYRFIAWLDSPPDGQDFVYQYDNRTPDWTEPLTVGRSAEWSIPLRPFEVGKTYRSNLTGNVHKVVDISGGMVLSWRKNIGAADWPDGFSASTRKDWTEITPF